MPYKSITSIFSTEDSHRKRQSSLLRIRELYRENRTVISPDSPKRRGVGDRSSNETHTL
jgi:hypothetical protein